MRARNTWFLSLITVIVIGLLDYVSGYEISFGIFYLIPIAIVTWTYGLRLGLLAAISCAAIWLLVELMSGHQYLYAIIPYWNSGVRLGFFIIVSYLLNQARCNMETDARMAAIVENSEDAIISKTIDGIVISWNEGAKRIYGYTAAEIIGKSVNILIPHDKSEYEARIIERINIGERIQAYETVRRRKDGQFIQISLSVSPIRNQSGAIIGISSISYDITERKQLQKEFECFFNVSLDMLCIAGFDGYFKVLNPLWAQTLGWTDEELKAKPFLDFVHPEDREATMTAAQELASGQAVISFENRYQCKDGTYKWILWNSTTIPGQQMIYSVAHDMTKRKLFEEENVKLNQYLQVKTSQLQAANKELETFAYSVSHDLRTPLRAIDGFSRILLDEYTDKLDDEGRRVLNVISKNTVRMGQLIDDILSFSRLGRTEMSVSEIDMEKLVKSVVNELKPMVHDRNVELIINTLPPSYSDRAMIRVVMVNLINNAIKFTRTRTVARIEIGGQSENSENIYFVRDNGVGFDMSYQNKLFGVFQRLHSQDEFEGTGIGLALVKQVITRHGGRVWAEGKVDEGAIIHFTLPRKREKENEQ